MSGHSKWHSIKHKKATIDAKRGKAFTQVANQVALAARSGGDPEMNFKLRLAIAKAKSANMPAANIERAIKRGTGELGGGQISEITYEAMLPGGASVIIECATDNKNRTGPEVKAILSKNGGRLADVGSAAYLYGHMGVVVVKASDVDAATLDAIEAGAEEVKEADGQLTIYTKKNDLSAVQTYMAKKGYKTVSAELEYIPKNIVEMTDEKHAAQIMRIMEALEDHDDVSATHSNFDMSDELMQRLDS